MPILILWFIILVSVCSNAQGITSLSDFEFHIDLHRKRVLELGLALRERFYPDLPYKETKVFLKLHDRAKKKYARELYVYFNQSGVFALIDTINDKDAQYQIDFFLNRLDIFTDHFSKIKRIELIADQVDRGLDPIAAIEFGRPMELASERIIIPPLQDQALWLEANYERLTNQLQFCQHYLNFKE